MLKKLKHWAEVPFAERNTPLRGALDLVSGAYPRFLFGGAVKDMVPVFHFHDVSAEYLEPYLAYLEENKYTTITTATLEQWIYEGQHPGERSVMLCFDDARASMWTVVLPLLRKYRMDAVTYVVPGRVAPAETVRDTLEDGRENAHEEDWGALPFATWPELLAMHESGYVDVQAHTHAHARIFCSSRLSGFVAVDTAWPMLAEPAEVLGEIPSFYEPRQLGSPLFPMRSRMSDARRFLPDRAYVRRCREIVDTEGGAVFFQEPDWRGRLEQAAGPPVGRYETSEEHAASLRFELERPREILRELLNGHTVTQVCLPWAVCGQYAEQLIRELGYRTAVADRLFGRRAVVRGHHPFRLMRLKHQYIYCLPGAGRKYFFYRWMPQ